jgi:hypothetical protein
MHLPGLVFHEYGQALAEAHQLPPRKRLLTLPMMHGLGGLAVPPDGFL